MAPGSFGTALRQARARQGISLTALSRLVYYSAGYLSRVERDERAPSAALALACDKALDADGALAGLATRRQAQGRARSAAVRPAQLPAAVPGFTGRAAALTKLHAAASALCGVTDASAATVMISAISGMAGVGKTALAVHFAHHVADRFPDGQLYVNLRGFDPSGPPVSPAAAIRGFLDALAVPAGRIPSDTDAQAALYRSLLAGKRLLILADNARDAAQVRPLLPGAPGCLVLVTSRNQLTGLAATDSARLIYLDVLTPAEAGQLLAARLGADRIAAEQEAADEIIAACGRLPLALALVCARAARPGLPLSALATELSGGRLDALTDKDAVASVPIAFSWSYHALTPEAARLFRLLGLHPGPDISAAAAASLACLPPPQARVLLAELANAHLIREHRPGRYALHDLLRAYALGLASQVDTASLRRAAIHRMLDHYLHTSKLCAELQDPLRNLIALAPRHAGVTPEAPAGADQALAWFTAEHAVLLAVIERAARDGFDQAAYQLAWTIWTYLHRHGHWRDQAVTQQLAVAAAQRLGDQRAEADAHRGVADAYVLLGRLDDARSSYEQALALHREVGDLSGEGRVHHNLALLCGQQHHDRAAVEHARQALRVFRVVGDHAEQAQSLNTAGWFLSQLGEPEKALMACTEALTIVERLGDRYRQAHTWDSLGVAHHQLGHHDQAAACFRRALHLIRLTGGDQRGQAAILDHLGDTYHLAGRHGAAGNSWRQALAILDDLGQPDAGQVRAKLTALWAARPAPRSPAGGSADTTTGATPGRLREPMA